MMVAVSSESQDDRQIGHSFWQHILDYANRSIPHHEDFVFRGVSPAVLLPTLRSAPVEGVLPASTNPRRGSWQPHPVSVRGRRLRSRGRRCLSVNACRVEVCSEKLGWFQVGRVSPKDTKLCLVYICVFWVILGLKFMTLVHSGGLGDKGINIYLPVTVRFISNTDKQQCRAALSTYQPWNENEWK